jgi:hypothetical protein
MARIWLEAESFGTLGGWVIDQQSVEPMGSAYVMAHGMGVPVVDAVTQVLIPETAAWTVWVRTRDWTAVWERGTPAGIFRVLINGQALPTTLGTNGPHWAWQRADTVVLAAGEVGVSLHDLTGFNGRCDALYLTTAAEDHPPDRGPELAAFRQQMTGDVITDDPVLYDLAVAGGGMAGVCAAIAALRQGLRVVLVQDRAVLGGCNSSEIRVPLGGFAHAEPFPKLGNVVTEIEPVFGRPGIFPAETYEDVRKANVFRLQADSQYRLVLNESVVAVERAGEAPPRISAFVGRNARTGTTTRYRARFFADCTGDAVLARMMGAETMYGRESRSDFGESLAPEKGDNQVMGMSVLWASTKAVGSVGFPDIDWGIPFSEGTAYYVRSGDWEWETGQYRNQATAAEAIRDYGLMAILANWSFLKNRSKRKAEWASDTLAWITPIGGKRESYRVVGDYVLSQRDIEERIRHADATGSMTWSLDLHFPDPEHGAKFAEPFRSCAYHRGIEKPYPVPFRCLYARDVRNLFLGGRHISATHVAFSCLRVMRTLGILGEVIGLAAAVCAREDIEPRDVSQTHFDKLKAMMEKGVPVPTYHAYECDDSETYHFKELGQLSLVPSADSAKRFADPELQRRIGALGVQHKHVHPGLDASPPRFTPR